MFYFNDNIYILERSEDFNKSKSIGALSNPSEEGEFLGSSSAYTTCHKYCLADKKYYENVFRLPESWYPFSRSYGNLISIDKTNKFVLIIASKMFYDGAEKK